MSVTETVVSHHLLRRTARARRDKLNLKAYGSHARIPKKRPRFQVRSYVRGPFGFKVVDTRRDRL
jgi:hypothetical protein